MGWVYRIHIDRDVDIDHQDVVDPPKGFHNLYHRSIGVQIWGFYFLDPQRGLGTELH